MYDVGLQLKQKLDKISKYDQCSEDVAKVMGTKDYCHQLFKDSHPHFLFWSQNDIGGHCDKISKFMNQKTAATDKCAAINDAMF